jgi:predicted ABC-type transport system involved in lysophospholipase L1 biosynthesis ATPase subunit
LLEIVQRQPLVAVLGPSGSGKSSVVFAGLLPRLRNASREGGRMKDEGGRQKEEKSASSSSLQIKRSSFTIASFRPGATLAGVTAALLPLLQPKLSADSYPTEADKLAGLRQGRTRLPAVSVASSSGQTG